MSLIFIGIGIYLIVIAVKRIYAKNWSKGISVDLDFSASEVYPGDKVIIMETVANANWLPLPMINVKFGIDKRLVFEAGTENTAVSDKSYKSDVFSLLFFQKVTRKLPFTCTQRGYYYIDDLDIVSTDLFMKNVVSLTSPVKQSITVYPKPLSSELIDIPYNRIMGTLLTKRYTYEDPFEFRSIREYQTYDTMRSINWNASARTGDLKVNVYENTSCQEVCILLNLENEGIWEYEDLKEASISLACSLAYRLTEQGIGVSILSNGVDAVTTQEIHIACGCDEGHRKTIATQLSRIDLKKNMQEFSMLLDKERRQISAGAMLVMVSMCKKNSLQEAYTKLAAECSDSLWILPLLSGMNGDMELYDKNKVIRWEV
ncbi:MAG: DUF58 domain-containing protein [Eubacterium sp.]|nr:DUF58 domain-containing protein [Eubacterium sp.]